MPEKLYERLKEFLSTCQGREVSLKYLREELRIDPNTPAWDGLREYLRRLIEKNIVKPTGKNDGTYKVIQQINPVQVFGQQRERRPLFTLLFPREFKSQKEMDFAPHIIVREGDLITIGGEKSMGKTTLCLNFLAENIDKKPILMGNEYTVFAENQFEPAPRFLSRLDTMSEWVNWTDENGMDKFTLLPVTDDYAEHIVKDRINIIDWINLDGDKSYDISKVLYGIKHSLGRGVGIISLQKGEGAINPRGGQFVRDFSDVEIHLSSFSKSSDDVLLTIKGVKEKDAPIVGKNYTYTINYNGTRINNFHEVIKCYGCNGDKIRYIKGEGKVECSICKGIGWLNKE